MTDGIERGLVAIAASIDRLADSIGANTAALRVAQGPPGAQVPPQGPPAAPRAAEKTIQQKRGGLIYYACRDNGFANKCGEVGEQVLGRPMANDARLWPDADQVAVLDQMKAWSWIQEQGRN